MLVYVQRKGGTHPQEFEAANVEEKENADDLTSDLVLTNDNGKMIARFALGTVESWWIGSPR